MCPTTQPIPLRRFDLPSSIAYSYAPCCETDDLGRTASDSRRNRLDAARFDRVSIHALDLLVCPENRKRFLEAVRIRTLRTQQRAISQCQKMAQLVMQISNNHLLN
jgi:hypothetical protein